MGSVLDFHTAKTYLAGDEEDGRAGIGLGATVVGDAAETAADCCLDA